MQLPVRAALLYGGLAALVFVGLPMLFLIGMIGEQSNACWEGGEAVAKARELSTERLSALYRDMKVYATDEDTPFEGYSGSAGEWPIPAEFADLGATRVRPAQANIMLEGCVDAFVDLWFEGLTNPDESARIVLTWGDHHESGDQTLWQESAHGWRALRGDR